MLAMGMMGGGGAIPWYLAGGIPASDVLGAYKAVGAANYSDSKINLANPGTYNLKKTDTSEPDWSTDLGWKIPDSVGASGLEIQNLTPTYDCSLVIKVGGLTDSAFATLAGTNDYFALYYKASNNFFTFYRGPGATALNSGAITDPFTGTIAICKRKLYINGVLIGENSNTATGTLKTIWLLGVHAGTTYVTGPTGYITAAAIYNRELTADENLAIHLSP